MSAGLAFTGHDLDRDDHTRADPERLAAMRARSDARLLSLDGVMPQFDGEGALAFTALPEASDDRELVYLGLRDGAPLFVAVPDEGDMRHAVSLRETMMALARLDAAELALFGGARSVADWHARHRFCARCGSSTHIAKGGWQRNCEACEAQHFPRVDPVAIMLVERDGDLLVGRGRGWPERSYSALAGFIEPGESVEEAVTREVLEEVGVRVHSATYIASQPWPFPSQLMIGCHGFAEARELVIDRTEIEDARWFTREEVADAIANGSAAKSFVPPPATAIANYMLQWWLEKTA
ncbi:NAD(+) diphosphatase [Aurantiacibacter poecillastricola]|uniref:NAD(+) diphosphatase n=1 Tax=Aurantiacibacter poecillastricola TaxID=3064385 RepID=UPI00273F1B12|nr:NAD(+) diphosphatase [Aurantiacibacter sp. 219JJ12-13]MDP5261521.1 NAD(+) diphosphatase [Aurantiacibacter sp. 219JJ12-13]